MAYLFVSMSLIFLTLKGFLGKKTSIFVGNTGDAVLFTLMRMLICIPIGLIPIAIDNAWSFLALDGGMAAICLLVGAANAVYISSWILAIRHCTMVTMDVMLTIGSIIPAVLCHVLDWERLRIPKVLGFLVVILATVILAGGGKTVRKKKSFWVILLPILSAVGEGTVSFSQQLYKHYYSSADALAGVEYPQSIYHFYTYVIASVFLIAFFAVYQCITVSKMKAEGALDRSPCLAPLKKTFWFIAMMAACMFIAAYFQTEATSSYGMSSQVMYPLIKAGSLVLNALVAQLFFGERITRRRVIGVIVALVGIVVMNVF